MTDIISIATTVPDHCHQQKDIFNFMQCIYQIDDVEKRKLRFLYNQSGIDQRYSVISDFSNALNAGMFFSNSKEISDPSLERRMNLYDQHSLILSIKAIKSCINNFISEQEITHLITVSCTGMSAPGLDLHIVEHMQLKKDIFRTSINFMGCYAAIHALKLADMIAKTTPEANIIIVATELCTLHFQTTASADNIASSLLFADGSAAVLISNKIKSANKIRVNHFHSQIAENGKSEMAWQLASNGFQMKLSGYIPQLIEADIESLIETALNKSGATRESIQHWCIHPGGKRILDSIEKKLLLNDTALNHSREVLRKYGNMSSPTILFVLKEIFQNGYSSGDTILGTAFGPGLTMETFTAHCI